jgi:integrase
MALTVPDLDFHRKTIRVNKSADDLTRQVRQPKTKKSVALLPMPSYLEAMLRGYLRHHWKANPSELLFPAPRRRGFARSRNNVVRVGLEPILQKLGMPAKNVGLHAFRHGLATELAESEPITVLQTQMRHADVRTTLKVCSRHSAVAARLYGTHCEAVNRNKCSDWNTSGRLKC